MTDTTMPDTATTASDRTLPSWLGLVGFLAVCFGVAALGALATGPAVDGWYQTIAKPDWTPPSWLFGPVWTVLYGLMAVSAWLVWKQNGFRAASTALTLFFVQLALNLAWSFIFFDAHAIGWALVEIVVLLAAISATIGAFRLHSVLAAWLLVPYALWVGYATLLNAAIWTLNA